MTCWRAVAQTARCPQEEPGTGFSGLVSSHRQSDCVSIFMCSVFTYIGQGTLVNRVYKGVMHKNKITVMTLYLYDCMYVTVHT